MKRQSNFKSFPASVFSMFLKMSKEIVFSIMLVFYEWKIKILPLILSTAFCTFNTEVGRACGMHGRGEKSVQGFGGKA
jgi:hypothetical protein